jgi:hypothetical protein
MPDIIPSPRADGFLTGRPLIRDSYNTAFLQFSPPSAVACYGGRVGGEGPRIQGVKDSRVQVEVCESAFSEF